MKESEKTVEFNRNVPKIKGIKMQMVTFDLKPKIGVLKRLWYWLINKNVGTLWLTYINEKMNLGDIFYRELRGSIAFTPIFLKPTDKWGLSFDNKNGEMEALITPIGVVYE